MRKSLVLSIALAALAAAQAPQGQAPQSLAGVVRLNKAPISNEVLQVKMPRPVERQLSNGLKLLVVESHRVPTIYLRLMTPAGTLRVPEGMAGLADATADMMQLGTKTRSSKEIAERLAELGASVGFTSYQENTIVYLTALTENFDAALDVLADIILNPTFPQDELDKWKTRQRAEIEQFKTSPGALGEERLMKTLFPSDVRRFIRPTAESLDKITREKLIEFHQAYYRPAGQWVGVTGDVTPSSAAARLEKAFGTWKGGPVPRISAPTLPRIEKKQIYLVPRPNSVQTFLVIANHAMERTHPDYFATNVLNRVLGNGPSSRLFRTIREEKGYTYGISSTFVNSPSLNYFMAATSVRTEVTEPALAAILEEFRKIRETPVPAGELADAKSNVIGNFALALEQPATVIMRWMDQRQLGLPEDYWDTYAGKTQAVTAEDVMRVAKKYIPMDDAQIVAVGEASKIEEPLKKFGPLVEAQPDQN